MLIRRDLRVNPIRHTKDLKRMIDAIKLLERYYLMLDSDASALENIGREMEENDEKLAKIKGPQPTGIRR